MITCTASGINAIILTPTDSSQPIALADEALFLFKAPATNTAAVTIEYGGLTPIAGVKESPTGQVALVPGDIIAGCWYIGLCDIAAGSIVITPFTASGAAGPFVPLSDAPYTAPIHPESGIAQGHGLVWGGENRVFQADYMGEVSTDPTTQAII
ncbi:hypothetical protein ACYOEI_37065, partial [Singulisphaera rosea]